MKISFLQRIMTQKSRACQIASAIWVGLFVLFIQISSADAAVKIERVVSAKGIEAWLVHDSSVPVISVAFEFRGGSSLDPTGKEGLSEMITGLLDEGAGEFDSQAFQKILEDESVYMSFGAGPDGLSGNLRMLSAKRERAFDLLRLSLTQPRFDAEPVKRIQASADRSSRPPHLKTQPRRDEQPRATEPLRPPLPIQAVERQGEGQAHGLPPRPFAIRRVLAEQLRVLPLYHCRGFVKRFVQPQVMHLPV